MYGMMKRHEVQVLLKAGLPQAEVARIAGVSLRSVQRIQREPSVAQVDDPAERGRLTQGGQRNLLFPASNYEYLDDGNRVNKHFFVAGCPVASSERTWAAPSAGGSASATQQLRRRPLLPALRITATVPHGENQNIVAVQLVVHDVGKATKATTTRLPVYSRPDLRSPLDPCDADLETLDKGGPETGAALLVPTAGSANIIPCNATEDRPKAHSSAQSCRRTSSQGTTSSGLCRCSSRLRASSARCGSGIGNSSPSAAIESQTSSTSWMRSASESLRISSRRELAMASSLPPTPSCGKPGPLALAAGRHG